MCAPQDIQAAPLSLRTAGRELDDISFRLGQLVHLVEATSDRVADHSGPDVETNARASALLMATTLMLTTMRASVEGLVERMLNASEV